ncbi:LacI family DNA-binding transcriptional regulator [Nonomuraea sp. SMC257]|uniref:LacI family DNA-binding transcriptional regulator n=1 Tax=Nonomuraea montanisoli TaxID=2741721 RepID=A0A7Y6M4B8_9ACTN|nr:LacI family DNA-binding transcriptional regulator [Nonomuraea montanisoli]NUW34638.1 LacI family DNA-binding transcriptional regulator [Nonomuraea montanisoli]
MAKRPTVYDVAQRAGVSIATVSFTFRQPEKVKPTTRDSVLAAAHALGYVPSASARGLAKGRTGALGLFSYDYLRAEEPTGAPAADMSSTEGGGEVEVVRDGDEENLRAFPLYVDEVQRGVELECRQRGYALLIGGGSHADSGAIITDVAGRVDGLAVFPHTVPDDVLDRIASRIPVVALSESPHHDNLSHVTIDNAAAMQALTGHLIADHGLTDLLFVGDTRFPENGARFEGFRTALRAAGLPVPRKPLAQESRSDGRNLVAELLARGRLPQALVCVTDDLALDLMDMLAENGISVPGRVAVTGFDGIVAGRISRPALTTIRQPMERMGRAAVDILIDRLEHRSEPPICIQLPARLVLRESCGCSTA